MQTFREMTGSTEEAASYWLEAANFDVETAISLFFSSGGGNGGGGGGSSSSSSGGMMHGSVPSSSSGMAAGSTAGSTTFPIPSASSTASYLDYHSSTGVRNRHADEYDEEGVRRPDSVKKQRLVDDASYPSYPDNYRSRAPLVSTFASAAGNTGGEKEQTLATMYRAPIDMYVSHTHRSIHSLDNVRLASCFPLFSHFV